MNVSEREEDAPIGVEMLSEPVVVQDTFVTGMADVETIDAEGTLRLTFFTKRRSSYGGDDFTIEARLVVSSTLALTIAKTIVRHFGLKCLNAACGAVRRLN
ncbi:hypothetical protein [Neoaquamicrobium sediminum]|uniref:hypothetical protein n=1 Tax=Neoaquamicrobium sediminum TaxID=1849104 RepID=UPI001565001A|nr:hypothetical protein [Mesorhizobium sediminum]NRC55163.1 hypothetical protein [Mesorhizobium sediminum]